MTLVAPDALVSPSAPHFRWQEFSGWRHATSEQAHRVRRLVETVLQPARDQIGEPVFITRGGWIWSRHGYPREGVHETGGAADLAPQSGDVFRLYSIIRDLPGVPYGQVLLHDDHVHVHLPGRSSVAGYAGHGDALLEAADGSWVPDPLGPAAELRAGIFSELPGGWVTLAALAGGFVLAAQVDRGDDS